ncbi:MAG: Na+/H+ antiporter subunit E [Alphaproteobacteria bacterium]|nr:Na+/H+ antiporter subunit E [Alphaproteobacteria bacterium]MBE8220032.1 Na+/H+ antiporter subunit E [Alphaproteobacteria bacterium]
MRPILISTLLMYGLWLALSDQYTPLFLSLGAGSAVGVSLIAYRMGVLDAEGLPLSILWRLPRITAWLVWEILKSNIIVGRYILNPRAVAPVVMRIKATQKSKAALVTHANFITLTPGTVTIAVNEAQNEILVHGLSRAFLDEAMMNPQINLLEGK